MSFEFERGDINPLLLTVLRLAGTIPTFPGDYTTPKFRISHINGGSEVEDVAFTNMTQVPASNRWYHKYTIPALAPFTKYLVTYEVTIEGVTTLSTEEFEVVPEPGTLTGSGEFVIDLNFVNSTSLDPLIGATVRIFDKNSPSTALAQAETDNNGKVTLFLNSGSYLLEVKKVGVITEVHTLVVNPDGSHDVTGD